MPSQDMDVCRSDVPVLEICDDAYDANRLVEPDYNTVVTTIVLSDPRG